MYALTLKPLIDPRHLSGGWLLKPTFCRRLRKMSGVLLKLLDIIHISVVIFPIKTK